jgi:DNA polymerase-3 subunit gamma/tau
MAKRKSSPPINDTPLIPVPEDNVPPVGEPEDPKTPEEYTVLARRYRPQQFADLVGQEAVAQALINALQSNRVAHAYLFTGARGVGKTSTARILAKALNCVRGPTATPCDTCEICQSIASGEDVDVLEIDGASNRGIDEVREIRQNVQFRPSRSRYKIYIVDEVHMLTAPAFNALLKTLEEPPAHVKFIFATTEAQKIPITILSRCQRFDFAGIGTPRIVERLRAVVASEGMQADDEALELIARRAGGSMRDAQSLLDQLLAFGGERLTSDQVHRLLGTAHDDRVLALASAVLQHEPGQALSLLRQSAEEGLQLGELLDQLMNYWRDLMVISCAGPDFPDLNVPARHRETLSKQAASLKLDTILAGLDVLSATKARLRGSSHGQVLLEMALVRLGRLDDLVSLSQMAQWLSQPRAASERPPPAASASGPVPSARAAAAAPVRAADTVSPPEAIKKKPVTAPEATPAPTSLPLTPETLPQVWQTVLSQVGPMMASNLEKAGLPAISGPNTLVLRFPIGYNFEREHCQQPTNVARVEDALRKITGAGCNLRVESAGSDAAAMQAKSAEDAENSQSRYRRQRMEAMREPLVKRAVEVLGAQLMDVDEGFGATPSPSSERNEGEEVEEA